MEKVGHKLRNLRKERGYSLENVEDELRISPPTLSRIENDYTGTKWTTINQLCDFYKVPVYELLTPVEKRLIIKEELLEKLLERILEKIFEKFYEDKLRFYLEKLHKELSQIITMINESLEK